MSLQYGSVHVLAYMHGMRRQVCLHACACILIQYVTGQDSNVQTLQLWHTWIMVLLAVAFPFPEAFASPCSSGM